MAATGSQFLRDVPTPGDRLLNVINEFEYLEPIHVGDRLSSYQVIADIFQRPTRLDPLSTWVISETHIVNQRGDTVAIGRNTMLTHRTPEEVAQDPDGAGSRP